MRRRLFLSWAGAILGAATRTAAAPKSNDKRSQPSPPDDAADDNEMLNVVTPTLGGKQFWADELWFRDWRIQRNVFTGHYRLIDDNNLRRAWGDFDDCRAKLDAIKRQKRLPPLAGRAVIVLHGLIRSRSASGGMARYLREESGLTAIAVGYPSTRAAIDEHASSLAKVVEHLEGIEEVNFVGHSLGNIVIRRYLALQNETAEKLTARAVTPRVGRIVMIGAPNNGAQMAKLLSDYSLFKMVAGPPGQALGAGWNDFADKLATPSCEFGVIAGGRGDDHGYSPLLKGDNDLVVTVAEARLPGAADFLLVPVTHTFLMDSPAVQEATLRFLNEGYFQSAANRQPIPREEQR